MDVCIVAYRVYIHQVKAATPQLRDHDVTVKNEGLHVRQGSATVGASSSPEMGFGYKR